MCQGRIDDSQARRERESERETDEKRSKPEQQLIMNCIAYCVKPQRGSMGAAPRTSAGDSCRGGEEWGEGTAVRAAGPAVLRIHFVRNFHFVCGDEKRRKRTRRTASLERTTRDAGYDEWT